MKSRHLKLGTRRSLLAWAQSGWVARQIERLNPGVTVELVGIETRGDRIQDVSLQSVEGKEFFVAELDEALSSGKVDLSVHSMKDLSLERPAAFRCAAVPRRENPRDAVLFGPRVLEKLGKGEPLRIGTSSPRRHVNLPPFLARVLPRLGGREPAVELVDIRGNVNTRLSRVLEPEGSARALDAVVLAFAGLIRLWADDAGRSELSRLLGGVRWMVLPLRECPAAPAQGALAVECRVSESETVEILSRLHDPGSARRAALERQLLSDWGGGCHQKFGATAVAFGKSEILYIRGIKPDGVFVEETRWEAASPGRRIASERAWDGSQWRPENRTEALPLSDHAGVGPAVFVAHARAVHDDALARMLLSSRLWTSGTSSWEKLARRGLWVEGCAEGMGFEELRATLTEPVLGLPAEEEWSVLTHERAAEGWPRAKVVPTYRIGGHYPQAARQALASADALFWSSGSQFDELRQWATPGALHACGPGKTAAVIRARGIDPWVFPSAEEWRKWIRKHETDQPRSR